MCLLKQMNDAREREREREMSCAVDGRAVSTCTNKAVASPAAPPQTEREESLWRAVVAL